MQVREGSILCLVEQEPDCSGKPVTPSRNIKHNEFTSSGRKNITSIRLKSKSQTALQNQLAVTKIYSNGQMGSNNCSLKVIDNLTLKSIKSLVVVRPESQSHGRSGFARLMFGYKH